MEAASNVTRSEPLDPQAMNTCPIHVEGPQRDRIHEANDGIHQVCTILEALKDTFEDNMDEEYHVTRALISRAHVLAQASLSLLSIEDDNELVGKAEIEVRRG